MRSIKSVRQWADKLKSAYFRSYFQKQYNPQNNYLARFDEYVGDPLEYPDQEQTEIREIRDSLETYTIKKLT